MSAVPGRPGAAFAPSSRGPQPYAAPGIAKPAGARGAQSSAAGAHGSHARGSARAAVREKWNRVFGGRESLFSPSTALYSD